MFGASNEIRTRPNSLASYYATTNTMDAKLVGDEGFEPPTLCSVCTLIPGMYIPKQMRYQAALITAIF